VAFVHVQYTADDGIVYQRKSDSLVAAAIGATTEALFAHPKLPSNIKPRFRLCIEPNGHHLKVVVDAVGLAIWTTAIGGTLAGYPNPLNRSGTGGTPGPTVTLTLGGTVGEKTYSR
jgi:hypothetical protein